MKYLGVDIYPCLSGGYTWAKGICRETMQEVMTDIDNYFNTI